MLHPLEECLDRLETVATVAMAAGVGLFMTGVVINIVQNFEWVLFTIGMGRIMEGL